MTLESIRATVIEGYRVSSGDSYKDPTFNEVGGTIRLQAPKFKKRGLDFDVYFGGKIDDAYVCGTLGCSIAPLTVAIAKPEFYFTGVR